MKLASMQPYFFPYLGYFALIANTDKFVFFDTPQYEARGWMNRNRIINLKEGFTYITVPIKKTSQQTAIKDIMIAEPDSWADRMMNQLGIYRKRAPHYADVMELLHDITAERFEHLSRLCIVSTQKVCEYIGIKLDSCIFSEMNLDVGVIHEPDEWALRTAQLMGYDTYVNPPGGIDIFSDEKYRQAGIGLQFLQINLRKYIQRIGRFEPGLSIIDVMMFCSPEEIRDMLKDYKIMVKNNGEITEIPKVG